MSPAINTHDQIWPAPHARPETPYRPAVLHRPQSHAAPVGCAANTSATGNADAADAATEEADSGVSLLAAVDFKWLMTGHGWWVDSARFHSDPAYAATLLDLAMASTSSALQHCAARLLAKMGGGLPAARHVWPGDDFAAGAVSGSS